MSGYAQRKYEYMPAYEAGYRAKTKAKPARHKGLSNKDRKDILKILLIGGLIGIFIITAFSYAAKINYNNNKLRSTNSEIAGEVESLKTELQSANNINDIEEKAKKKLGMVYADGEKYVVLSYEKQPKKNFAGNLKAQAFK